jgi:heme oxygenase
MALAIVAALTPWAGGKSPVGIWSHTVHQARTETSIGAAYVVAGVAIGGAWLLDRHSSPPGEPGRALPRFLLVTASLGALGVLHWWDPIHLLTGVDL